MITVHNVVAASATVGLTGEEGTLIRVTFVPMMIYLLLARCSWGSCWRREHCWDLSETMTNESPDDGARGPAGEEQRADPRVAAEYRIHLLVDLHGFDSSDRRFEANGITVNISRYGAMVRVNQPMVEGARCLVHLPEGEGHLGKTLIYGTVLRTAMLEETFEVAIRFDTRLQTISLED